MGYKTRTTAYFEQDGHTFPLPFTGQFYQERLHVTPDGLTAILGVLVQDEDAEDPFDGDEGEFYQFTYRSIHYTDRPDVDQFKRIIRANPGRVFTHNGTENCHGPGTVSCHVTAGPFTVADIKDQDRKNHTMSEAEHALDHSGGYYIAPEDATDPAKYAAGALKTYSQWCNGEVYGVCVWKYTRNTDSEPWGEPNRNRECWGFIGADYAKEELTSQFAAAVAEVTQ